MSRITTPLGPSLRDISGYAVDIDYSSIEPNARDRAWRVGPSCSPLRIPPVYVFFTLSQVSVSLSNSVPQSMCPSVTLSPSLCVPQSLCRPVYLSRSPPVPQSLYPSVTLSLSLCVPQSLCPPVSVSPSHSLLVYVSLTHSLSQSLCLYHNNNNGHLKSAYPEAQSFSHSVPPVSVSRGLCVLQCLSLCPLVSVSVSVSDSVSSSLCPPSLCFPVSVSSSLSLCIL